MTVVAVTLSLYGIHVLGTLRQEVFEARRLNQYQLGERLGSGGMGEVYHAEHRLLKRPCAVKLIRPESSGDQKALERFEREVRATAGLSHPNIVEIFDYGRTDDGTFYYVMEYLRGLSLDKLVGKYGPLPAGRVISLLGQACEGLAEAHAAGLIHRDLKPANIFAAQLGRRFDVVKLLDFGLVQHMADESDDRGFEDAITGTPQYMAPEQVRKARALDHRCDLYALGAVAYFLLTGLPPFDGKDVLRLMMAHASEPVLPPSRHIQGVPEDLETVVLRCLEKSPDARYPDAESLHAALDSCADAHEWDARKAQRWWQDVVE
jgi:serine/threonine-protein kinase